MAKTAGGIVTGAIGVLAIAVSCGGKTSQRAESGVCGAPERREFTMVAERLPSLECLPRAVPSDPDGNKCMHIIAVTVSSDCDCTEPGLTPAPPIAAVAIIDSERERGACDATGKPDCSELRLCKVMPFADWNACLTSLTPPDGAGYCYLDAELDLDNDGVLECFDAGDDDCMGNPDILRAMGCDSGSRRALRIINIPDATFYVSGYAGSAPC